MGFNLYLPPQTTINPLHKVPLLIYLAGLTCTGDNGAEKGFFQHAASQKGIAILYPDTSPRAYVLGPISRQSRLTHHIIRWSGDRGRKRLLRLWYRRGILCRCNQRAVVEGLQNVQLYYIRAAEDCF